MENSSAIGRVYRTSWRARAFPLILLALGSFETVGLLTGRLEGSEGYEMFWPFGLVLGGAIFTAAIFTRKVILMDDAIEVRNVFGTNRILYSEIRGRRETVWYGLIGVSGTWKLERKTDAARPIYINNSYTLDNVFFEWFNQIPDLDAEDVD